MECRTKVKTSEQSLESFFRQWIFLFKLFLMVLNFEKWLFEIVLFIYVNNIKTSVYSMYRKHIVCSTDFYFEKLQTLRHFIANKISCEIFGLVLNQFSGFKWSSTCFTSFSFCILKTFCAFTIPTTAGSSEVMVSARAQLIWFWLKELVHTAASTQIPGVHCRTQGGTLCI